MRKRRVETFELPGFATRIINGNKAMAIFIFIRMATTDDLRKTYFWMEET